MGNFSFLNFFPAMRHDPTQFIKNITWGKMHCKAHNVQHIAPNLIKTKKSDKSMPFQH